MEIKKEYNMNFKALLFACCATLFAAAPALAGDNAEMSEGEIRRIDGERVTLKHGPIDNLGMSPMTMVFEATDASTLEGLTAGDKVKFRAERQDGNYVVTEVVKAE